MLVIGHVARRSHCHMEVWHIHEWRKGVAGLILSERLTRVLTRPDTHCSELHFS